MKKLLLLIYVLLTGVSGAWASSTYFVGGRASTIETGKKYIIYNTATQSGDTRQWFLYAASSSAYGVTTNTTPLAFSTTDESYIWTLESGSTEGTYKIKNLGRDTYSAGGTTLGSAVDYTIAEYSTCSNKGGMASVNDDGSTTAAASITSSDHAVYIVQYGTTAYWNGTSNGFGTGKAHVYVLYEVVEIADGACYTIDFVSNDGSTRYGLKSSTTSVSTLTAGANNGDIYVAHSYTNAVGNKRWIFVNNSDGTYLAYHGAATSSFNTTYPINEFAIQTIYKGMTSNVTSDNCNGKVCITNDLRYTNTTNGDKGCYILKTQDNALTYDDSTAPYFNANHTSALIFTYSANAVSDAAALAIAKFDALYEVKDYLTYADHIPALFDSKSSTETAINSAATTDAVTAAVNSFWKSAEGKKFYMVNSTATGYYANLGTSQITATATKLNADAVMELEYAGSGKYYLKGCKSGYYAGNPSSGNTNPGTVSSSASATPLFIGNYANTIDNVVYFARTKAGSNNPEAIHYNSVYTDCGSVVAWAYDAGASQWNITAVTDEEYEALSNNEDITISYTLTDQNGITYSGTTSGKYGTRPISADFNPIDQTWSMDGGTYHYTANITMPFKVSNNEATYYYNIYMPSGTSSRYVYWYASSSNDANVGLTEDSNDTEKKPWDTTKDDYKYSWSIYGTPIDGFTFKNRLTGKYVKAPSSSGTQNTLFDETGTAFTLFVVANTNSTKWQVGNTGVTPTCYLSAYSHSHPILTYNTNGSHLGAYIMFKEAPDFDALESNLVSLCEAYSTFTSTHTIGEGLGEYYGNTYSDMATAYAKALNSSSVYTATQLVTDIATLENPETKLTLNMPTSGMFLKIRTKHNTYLNGVATTGNYTGFISCVSTPNKSSIFYYDSDNRLIDYGQGYKANGGYAGSVGGSGVAYTFGASATGAPGTYSIIYTENETTKYLSAYGEGYNLAVGENSDNVNGAFTLEAVTSLPVTISSVGYATFYAPVALTIPEGVTAYVAEDKGEYLHLEAIEGGIIPAETGVILKGAAGTYNFTITTGGSVGSNALTGTVSAISRPEGSYILSTSGGTNVGFYKDGSSTIPGFKAYLPYSGLNNVKGFLGFNFDNEETGIENLNENLNKNKAIFNLAGQRVAKPTQGLYIVNGKKVVIK